MRASFLNDALKSMYNVEKRGKHEVRSYSDQSRVEKMEKKIHIQVKWTFICEMDDHLYHNDK